MGSTRWSVKCVRNTFYCQVGLCKLVWGLLFGQGEGRVGLCSGEAYPADKCLLQADTMYRYVSVAPEKMYGVRVQWEKMIPI